jgi:hypothetical protein
MATRSIWLDPATDGPHILLLMHTKQSRWSLMVGQWEKGRAKHVTWFNPDTNRKPAKALTRIQRELHTDARSGIDNQTPLTRIEGPTPAFDAPTWTMMITGAAAYLIRKSHGWPCVTQITHTLPLPQLQAGTTKTLHTITHAPATDLGPDHRLFTQTCFHIR